MLLKSLFLFLTKPDISKFAIIGICNMILVLLLTAFFTEFFNIFYIYSVFLAYEISIISSFFMNDNWTFSKIQKSSRTYIRFLKFNTFSLIGLGINMVILFILTDFINIHYVMSECIAILITFSFNFISSKKISFKN
jgi:dolichol-phosphate mannosyltransferase